MDILGYIQHKIKPRPWGIECQYTVNHEGREINSVIGIPSAEISENDLEALILADIERIAYVPVIVPETEAIEIIHQDGTSEVFEVAI